ncbi:sensor histidine kinase [Halolactibacillus alkaliphilus]|uniref:Sensor histidine kinase n=1 Tax=Halolactibacillus alkaliphilus TaxID=442899 RepID=A0A511X4E8_9BACI|nr:ATP-binding protein [Halolactibacillus alkaliphilus]GEN57818.1 sensor histidine kinase [Halolactibacillus alkaliphilus]GGN75327.1 sensor histidine kinase [Halolactibacillus alkaliphilus]SFP05710.1 GHKL domain-containing protein [Halolactibacillus alkaliphilus]
MTDVFPEIPRLFTALSEWLACLVYISLLRKKYSGFKLVVLMSMALIIQSSFLISTGSLPIYFWIPSMLLAVFMMGVLIYVATEVSYYEAGYFVVKAFVAAELVASFQWQLHFYLLRNQSTYSFSGLLLLIITYGVVYFIIWYLEKQHIPKDGLLGIKPREFWSSATIGVAIFFISNLSFVSVRTPFSGQYTTEILNIRTLVDFGGFAILFAYHVQLNELRVRHELEAMQNIFKYQYTQYQQSKESIDLINFKYHDLKHQLIALKAETDPAKREAFIDEMQDEIKMFEAQHKTGHHVLDTLLTMKHLTCLKNNITLTAVADGQLLNGMDVKDIVTIFGNALDNAIEYERKVKDNDKRLIHVLLKKQHQFTIIQIENYFEGQLHYQDGLPSTTKKNKYIHGYGIKSIRHTAEKYGGTVQISEKNQWFKMIILLPHVR